MGEKFSASRRRKKIVGRSSWPPRKTNGGEDRRPTILPDGPQPQAVTFGAAIALPPELRVRADGYSAIHNSDIAAR